MLPRFALLEEEEHLAKRTIEKLQRDRNSGAISEDEFEDKYESVMTGLRLKFAQLMDGASYEAYKSFKNELPSGTP